MLTTQIADRRIICFTTTEQEGRSLDSSQPGIDWHARCIIAFLVLGVTARLIRYLLRFPLWGDEAMLAMNFLDRGFLDLLRPLDNHQVAPLLFLWTECAAIKLLGFNEWAVRLFPLICSIASMFVFHRMARLLLRGTALVLAVGMFAVSYSGIRYGAEMKPYAVDLLVSTILLTLTVRWWTRPGDTRWLWALAAFMPLALGFSFPAVFIAGGVSVAVATVLWNTKDRGAWIAWIALNAALVGGFLAWYAVNIRVQSGAELTTMNALWSEAFPPRDSVASLLAWLVQVHAGPLLAQPFGGDNWGSLATTLLCLVAASVVIRQRQYSLLVLCGMPFALNLLAAFLRRFPYGGHMRLSMFLAPIVCILAALGAAALLKRINEPKREKDERKAVSTNGMPWPTVTAIAVLSLLAIVSAARDFCLPGKEEQEIRKRDFARWFWGSMERNHEVACIKTDFGKTFPPDDIAWQLCISPQFLCNERIYSPQHSRGERPDMARVSRERPLACVQYWSHATPYDPAAFNRWLVEMQCRYDFVGCQHYPILSDNDADRRPEPADRVEVYEFVPKAAEKVVRGG